MLRNHLHLIVLAAFFAVAASTAAVAAAPIDLFNQVPRPPQDAAAAQGWVSDGRIVQPQLVAARQALEAERAGDIASQGAVASNAVAPATAGGSAEVQRAARAFSDYQRANAGDHDPQAALAKRKRWLQRALGQQQMEINERIQPCPEPCADAAVVASNQKQLQLRMRTLDTELRTWNALFDDWKKKRSSYLVPGSQHLAAAEAVAAGADERQLMAQYHAAMLNEVEMLLSITELSALRAAAITRGLDGSEPDSISGATKKVAAR